MKPKGLKAPSAKFDISSITTLVAQYLLVKSMVGAPSPFLQYTGELPVSIKKKGVTQTISQA